MIARCRARFAIQLVAALLKFIIRPSLLLVPVILNHGMAYRQHGQEMHYGRRGTELA